MRRAAILELMATLGMKGMRAAYDEVLAEAARRKHPPERVLGEFGTTKILGVKRRPFRFPDLCLPHWRARASVIRTSYKSYSRAPTAA